MVQKGLNARYVVYVCSTALQGRNTCIQYATSSSRTARWAHIIHIHPCTVGKNQTSRQKSDATRVASQASKYIQNIQYAVILGSSEEASWCGVVRGSEAGLEMRSFYDLDINDVLGTFEEETGKISKTKLCYACYY